MEGSGMNNSPKLLGFSPSPQPSPVKGEGEFLTFYEVIEFVAGESGRREGVAKLFGLGTPNAWGGI
jgi:hypothetical protein